MSIHFRQHTSLIWQAYQRNISSTQLRQPNGATIESALAEAKDQAIDLVRLAITAKLPGYAPPDAIYRIGTERGIVRGQSETDAVYTARLLDAWNSWQYAGTAYGLLRQLYALGYTDVTLNPVRGNAYRLTNGGTTLQLIAQPGGYSMDANSQPVLPVWAASVTSLGGVSIAVNQLIFPYTKTGYYYKCTAVAGTHTTGGTEPTWPTGTAFGAYTTFGTGTVAASGVAQIVATLKIKIVLAGEPGTAKFQYSLNGGTSYNGMDILIPTSGAVPIPGSGLKLTFTAGSPTSFLLNGTATWTLTSPVGSSVVDNAGANQVTWICQGFDYWARFDVVFNSMPASWSGSPPLESSDEVVRLKGVINAWKSGFSTCKRIIASSTRPWGGAWTWGVGTNWGGTSTIWTIP